MSITGVSIRRLNTRHEVSSWSQLAHVGLVQRLAEIRWVVVRIGNNHGDTNIAAEGRVPTVSRPHNEVVALDELVVKQACREYQSTVTVYVEVVGAVVDVRLDLVTHHCVSLRVLVLGKHLQKKQNYTLLCLMHY